MTTTFCPTCGSGRVSACFKTTGETVLVGETHYLRTQTWRACGSCGGAWDLRTVRGVGFTFEGAEKKRWFTSLIGRSWQRIEVTLGPQKEEK